MTDLPSQLQVGNGFRESGGPRPCRSQCRRPEPSAGQSACSPSCDCAVSFQRPRRLALCSVPLDLAVGLVWVKTADRTSASSAFCEIAAESRAVAWRKQWARKVGLGFKLTDLQLEIGQLGQLSASKTQPAKAA